VFVGTCTHSSRTKNRHKFSFGTMIVYPKAFHLHPRWLKYSTRYRIYPHQKVPGSIFINIWLILTCVRILPQKHRCIEQISMYWGKITFVRSVYVHTWEQIQKLHLNSHLSRNQVIFPSFCSCLSYNWAKMPKISQKDIVFVLYWQFRWNFWIVSPVWT